MKIRFALVMLAGFGLAACTGGESLLDMKSSVPQASAVQTGNNLALPPDLSLATPAATSDAYQSNGPVEPIAQPKNVAAVAAPKSPAAPTVYGAAVPGQGTVDVFDQAGISKVKPDGTAKTPAELNRELAEYYKKKKRLQNPGYGTVNNIGAIFQDQ